MFYKSKALQLLTWTTYKRFYIARFSEKYSFYNLIIESNRKLR